MNTSGFESIDINNSNIILSKIGGKWNSEIMGIEKRTPERLVNTAHGSHLREGFVTKKAAKSYAMQIQDQI